MAANVDPKALQARTPMRMANGIHCDSALAIALSLEECLLVDERDGLPPIRVGPAAPQLVRPTKRNGQKKYAPSPLWSRSSLVSG